MAAIWWNGPLRLHIIHFYNAVCLNCESVSQRQWHILPFKGGKYAETRKYCDLVT